MCIMMKGENGDHGSAMLCYCKGIDDVCSSAATLASILSGGEKCYLQP